MRLAIWRFEAAGLSWPLPDELTDAALEARLFAKTGNGNRQGHRRIVEPDWAAVHRELKRKHGTLSILWEEVHYRRARRILVLALPRALPRLGGSPVDDDAPGARGRDNSTTRATTHRW